MASSVGYGDLFPDYKFNAADETFVHKITQERYILQRNYQGIYLEKIPAAAGETSSAGVVEGSETPAVGQQSQSDQIRGERSSLISPPTFDSPFGYKIQPKKSASTLPLNSSNQAIPFGDTLGIFGNGHQLLNPPSEDFYNDPLERLDVEPFLYSGDATEELLNQHIPTIATGKPSRLSRMLLTDINQRGPISDSLKEVAKGWNSDQVLQQWEEEFQVTAGTVNDWSTHYEQLLDYYVSYSCIHCVSI